MKYQALPGSAARGFLVYTAMRSTALPSHQYGDPASVLEAKQAREQRQAQQEPKRRTLTVTRKQDGWSEARKRAEALFTNFAGGGAVSAVLSPAASATGLDPVRREDFHD